MRNASPHDLIEYIEAKKTAKKFIKQDIEIYENTLITDILENTGSTKRVSKLTSKGKTWLHATRQHKNTTTNNLGKFLENATMFYKKLYKAAIPSSKVQIKNRNPETPPLFLQEEIDRSLSNLLREKATGSDGISNEMLIYGKKVLTKHFKDIFDGILISAKVPEEWKYATIILLHKKGSKEEISNYRPIK